MTTCSECSSILCTGAYLACRFDKRLFFYIRLIDILTLTILQIICKFFVQYLSFRRQTNGMNHVILRIPKGVNITSIIPSRWSDAVWRTLCSNPHSQTSKIPKRRFTNVSFGIFHNLDQLLANRSKMTLSIWYLAVQLPCTHKIFLVIRYINNNKS